MSVQNFSFLARLEVAEKFVVVGWGGGVVGWLSRPSLGFSFSQAEQLGTKVTLNLVWIGLVWLAWFGRVRCYLS